MYLYALYPLVLQHLPLLFAFWCFAVSKFLLLNLQAVFSLESKPVLWLWKARVGCPLTTTAVFLLPFQQQPGFFRASLHMGDCSTVLDVNFPHLIHLHIPLGTQRGSSEVVMSIGVFSPQARATDGRTRSRVGLWSALGLLWVRPDKLLMVSWVSGLVLQPKASLVHLCFLSE